MPAVFGVVLHNPIYLSPLSWRFHHYLLQWVWRLRPLIFPWRTKGLVCLLWKLCHDVQDLLGPSSRLPSQSLGGVPLLLSGPPMTIMQLVLPQHLVVSNVPLSLGSCWRRAMKSRQPLSGQRMFRIIGSGSSLWIVGLVIQRPALQNLSRGVSRAFMIWPQAWGGAMGYFVAFLRLWWTMR